MICKNNIIEVKPIAISSAQNCLHRATSLFGQSYHNIDYYNTYCTSPDHYCIGAYKNGELVAHATLRKENKTQLEGKIEFKIPREINENFILLDAILVDELHQNQGIGIRLLEAIKTYIAPGQIVSLAWATSTQIFADKLYRKFHLFPLKLDLNIWQKDCDAGIFKCPKRNGACCCKAILYATQASTYKTE